LEDGRERVLTRKDLGARGEELAARHLARQGYRVLARNHRTSLGELDVIARDGKEVVFVEVKTRLSDESLPEESVDLRKVGRIARLAEAYLMSEGGEEAAWRIDVVSVVLDHQGELRRIEHFKNAVY
jgi:putative endonuclease